MIWIILTILGTVLAIGGLMRVIVTGGSVLASATMFFGIILLGVGIPALAITIHN